MNTVLSKIDMMLDKLKTLLKIGEDNGFVLKFSQSMHSWDTLTNKYTEQDEIVKEIFRLTESNQALRYDLTVPFATSLNNSMPKPFKRMDFGTVFRNGPRRSNILC